MWMRGTIESTSDQKIWVVASAFSLYISELQVAAAAKSLQLCPTLCDPIDGSPQAPPSLGFSRQERWKWVAIFFSNA